MGDEQLYVYGFQVVGHTNADANCHTYTDSDRYTYGYAHAHSDCRTHAHTYSNCNAYTYARAHAYTNCNSYTYTYANSCTDRTGGDAESATGVDLYFVKRDFYLERRQRDRLLSFRRQFATLGRYLQFRPSDRALENGE